MCLVLFVTISPQSSEAATNYNHQELSEYEGYGQAMYETIVEETSFITGQYTDNKQYVKDSISEIKDYANFWLNEQGNLKDACSGMKLFTTNCLGELTSSGVGYGLTIGDLVKKMFGDYDLKENDSDSPEFLDYTAYADAFYYENEKAITKPGYLVDVYHANGSTSLNQTSLFPNVSANKYPIEKSDGYQYSVNSKSQSEIYVPGNISWILAEIELFKKNRNSLNGVLNLVRRTGADFVVKYNGVALDKPIINEKVNAINEFINKGNVPQIIVPEPKAYLSCPDGTRIDMQINGATFLDAKGKVMQVQKNGVATIDSQICNLGWEKPKVDYVDNTAAISDKDGNWVDLLTGDLLKCVLTDNCETLKPTKPEEVKPLDNSLIQYVKNAYDYATGTLKVATDGLKSLGNGARGITDLYGIFFGWLPKEIVVLMTGGLGIMIGLRIFRK